MITRWNIAQKTIGKAQNLERMTKKTTIGMIAKTTTKTVIEGWITPTLAQVENQWRIYSDGAVAFVPLEKALPELVAACHGAGERLEQLDNEPF
jgi:hypothetical protein